MHEELKWQIGQKQKWLKKTVLLAVVALLSDATEMWIHSTNRKFMDKMEESFSFSVYPLERYCSISYPFVCVCMIFFFLSVVVQNCNLQGQTTFLRTNRVPVSVVATCFLPLDLCVLEAQYICVCFIPQKTWIWGILNDGRIFLEFRSDQILCPFAENDFIVVTTTVSAQCCLFINTRWRKTIICGT